MQSDVNDDDEGGRLNEYPTLKLAWDSLPVHRLF